MVIYEDHVMGEACVFHNACMSLTSKDSNMLIPLSQLGEYPDVALGECIITFLNERDF